MKRILLKKLGNPAGLQLESAPDLTKVNDNEVIIDVHYSGINFAEIVMRLGFYKDAPQLPYVPGYEVSGIITQVGKSVQKFKVGESVVSGTLFGGYASQVKVTEDLIFKIPAHLSLLEAAALPVNWVTAHAALIDMGRVRAGDKVLIDAATGGVGTIALQMLKNIGAQTIGLTSSASKLDFIRSYGAQAMTHEEFEQSKESDFDLILNSEGGSSVRRHYDRLASTGRVIALGISAAIRDGKRDYYALIKTVLTMPRFSLIAMFDRNKGVFALNALKLLEDKKYRKTLQEKWKAAESMQLKPHIEKVFPAEAVSQAHALLESKKARGKVMISWKS